MDLSDIASSIMKYHQRGKSKHDNEIGSDPDLFVIPFVIAAILSSPLMFASLAFFNSIEWLGGIFALLYFATAIFGYHVILGFSR